MNIKFRELKSELKKIQEDMRNDLTKLTVKTNETMICLKKKSEKVKISLKIRFFFWHFYFVKN